MQALSPALCKMGWGPFPGMRFRTLCLSPTQAPEKWCESLSALYSKGRNLKFLFPPCICRDSCGIINSASKFVRITVSTAKKNPAESSHSPRDSSRLICPCRAGQAICKRSSQLRLPQPTPGCLLGFPLFPPPLCCHRLGNCWAAQWLYQNSTVYSSGRVSPAASVIR